LGEFGRWGGKPEDSPIRVMDPIGQDINIYRGVFEQIKNHIERLIKILT
jgi:hypothetical protein